MQIVFFSHPNFLNSKSMPLFAGMIYQGMKDRGHQVKIWKPSPMAYLLPVPKVFKKWLGYIDQYLIFPWWIRWQVRQQPENTLFVFADQALGPWVPLVKLRLHVIHCHDFMALHSALGYYPQNPVSFTGRLYQSMIRRGFVQCENFISVSDKTQSDLKRFLPKTPNLSFRVYNGLNFPYAPMTASVAQNVLAEQGCNMPSSGFLLHVGGNQWYKNRAGVLHVYRAYCVITNSPLPLYMVGEEPTPTLKGLAVNLENGGHVSFLTGLPTQALQATYSLAAALVFPSIAEGFGWPIAEAMACGCLVLTTNEAPMTEVGGSAATYLPVMPKNEVTDNWAVQCAVILKDMLDLPKALQQEKRDMGIQHSSQFNTGLALDRYEAIYSQIVAEQEG